MPPPPSQTVLSLWRPLHLRVGHRVADALRTVGLGWSQAWDAHAQRANRRREWRGLAELSEHTLADIGAPDWVVLHAAERRASAGRRRGGIGDIGVWRGV